MPVWMIETFGSAKLDNGFWVMTLLPIPLWAVMLFFPRAHWARKVASPWLVPVFLAFVQAYFLYQLWSVGMPVITGADFKATHKFFEHPMVFLALWSQLQVLHLFLGTILFQESGRKGFRVPVELVLCWMFGALVLPIFVVRRTMADAR